MIKMLSLNDKSKSEAHMFTFAASVASQRPFEELQLL